MQISYRFLILASALSATISGLTVQAQDVPAPAPPMGHTVDLAVTALPAMTHMDLKVKSPAFSDGAQIPFENTQYRGNIFPGLQWRHGPDGTRSYLVVVQSAIGRPGGKSSLHLTLFNIPPDVTRLDAGMTTPPAGAFFGPNVHGLNQAYVGPHAHNFNMQTYHFAVFALDTVLPNEPNQSFEAIEAAAKDHILATGDLIGLSTLDPDSPEAAKLKADPASASGTGKAKME